MKRTCLFIAILFLGITCIGQVDSVIMLRGRVMCGRQAVPYAILQLQGTSIGTTCNDFGEYELRLPNGSEQGKIEVRSMGYSKAVYSVNRLLKNGQIKLQEQTIELREVRVESFRDGRKLLLASVNRIKENYHQRMSYPTYFYRDWRAIDGEMYLFDEAVMMMRRTPYSTYSTKRGYTFNPEVREMETNFKTMLRHRLLVCDAHLLSTKINDQQGVAEKLEYADNEYFFDPIETPEASYLLAKRMLNQHDFEPVQEFTDNGEVFYLVRSVGPNRNRKHAARYQYIIRKSNLAIVSITSVLGTFTKQAPEDAWVNTYFNRMILECDSSQWNYDLRDGKYTLSRYYNVKSYTLQSSRSGFEKEQQSYRESHDWVLTNFSLVSSNHSTDTLSVQYQTLPSAFGQSNYDSNFWGHYNTVPIDTLPLRLIKEKFHLQ